MPTWSIGDDCNCDCDCDCDWDCGISECDISECDDDGEFFPPVCNSKIQSIKAVLLPTVGSAHLDRPRFLDPSVIRGVDSTPFFGDVSVICGVEVSVSRSIFSSGLGTMQG